MRTESPNTGPPGIDVQSLSVDRIFGHQMGTDLGTRGCILVGQKTKKQLHKGQLVVVFGYQRTYVDRCDLTEMGIWKINKNQFFGQNIF